MKLGGKWNVGRFAFRFGSLAGIVAIAAMIASHRFGAGSDLSELASVAIPVLVGALLGAGIALARNAFFT